MPHLPCDRPSVARPLRLEFAGLICHVTSCGSAGRKLARTTGVVSLQAVENPDSKLFRKVQMRGARESDERRRIY